MARSRGDDYPGDTAASKEFACDIAKTMLDPLSMKLLEMSLRYRVYSPTVEFYNHVSSRSFQSTFALMTAQL